MDSISKNRLTVCPVCARLWVSDDPQLAHPTDASSTCLRYRPANITAEQAIEVTRQAGLTVADLGGSANGGNGSAPTVFFARGSEATVTITVVPPTGKLLDIPDDKIGLPMALQSLPADLARTEAQSEANWLHTANSAKGIAMGGRSFLPDNANDNGAARPA